MKIGNKSLNWIRMKEKTSTKKLRQFGIFFGIVFPFLFGVIFPIFHGSNFKYWTLLVGTPILIIGSIRPRFLEYPFKIWIFVGEILGWINSRIILSMIFFIILQPIAFIMKLFKYEPLQRIKPDQISYKENIKMKKVDLTRIF